MTEFTEFYYSGGVITFLIGPITIKMYALLIIIAIDTLLDYMLLLENTFH